MPEDLFIQTAGVAVISAVEVIALGPPGTLDAIAPPGAKEGDTITWKVQGGKVVMQVASVAQPEVIYFEDGTFTIVNTEVVYFPDGTFDYPNLSQTIEPDATVVWEV